MLWGPLRRNAPKSIGAAACRRALSEHTYAHRAAVVDAILDVPKTEGRRDQPMSDAFDIVILGLTVTSSWGNGHATTYRSLIRGLAARGHRILFLERDAAVVRGQSRRTESRGRHHEDLSEPRTS